MKRALRFLLSNGAAGLWLDPGLGKTSITLTAFNYLRKYKTARRMLVIAPLRVCRSVWPKEGRKWAHLNGLKIVFLHGNDKDQLLEEDDADVYCINPEGLQWLLSKGRFGKLDADVLCIDEVSRFKNTNTQRFKALKPYLGRFRRRWTLTGTPAPNGLMDIFGQIYCLDLGHALGPYVTHYRQKFFQQDPGNEYGWILKKGAEKEIYEKIAPLILRIDNSVLKGLPKLVFNNVMVDLPDKAMRVYKEMERELFTLLDDGTKIAAKSVGVAVGKCNQIANGGIYTQNPITGKRIARDVHMAKVEAVQDLVEEIGGKPVLLLYNYSSDKERLKRAFPNAPCVADMTERKADQLFDRWNRGAVPLMMAQPSSIGHGLNLQGGGQHIIWMGLPWDLELWIQAIDRLHRQGSRFKHVFVHCIIAKGTVDVIIRRTLAEKDATQNRLLEAIKNSRRDEVLVGTGQARHYLQDRGGCRVSSGR